MSVSHLNRLVFHSSFEKYGFAIHRKLNGDKNNNNDNCNTQRELNDIINIQLKRVLFELSNNVILFFRKMFIAHYLNRVKLCVIKRMVFFLQKTIMMSQNYRFNFRLELSIGNIYVHHSFIHSVVSLLLFCHRLGVAGLVFGHPFDTVKVHMQTQDFQRPKYTGTVDCITKLVRNGSVGGLYRGISSPMAGVAFINAIVFGVYGNVQRHSSDPNSLHMHFVAGSAAGLIQSVICSPMELAKTQLQLQNNNGGKRMFKGPAHCLQHIAKTEGLRGVFKGLGITAMRDVPGFSSYFVSYEMMMRMKENPGMLYTLMAGGLAGVASWVCVIPLDVIKSRLQADGVNGQMRQYSGMMDCWRKSYSREGWSFLTRGLGSTLIRAFPMNAVCFLVVSSVMKYFSDSNIRLPEYLSRIMADPNDLHHHRRAHIQGLLYIGAFSEAVCSSEITELANDIFDAERSLICRNKFWKAKFDSTFDLSTSEKNICLLSY